MTKGGNTSTTLLKLSSDAVGMFPVAPESVFIRCVEHITYHISKQIKITNSTLLESLCQ